MDINVDGVGKESKISLRLPWPDIILLAILARSWFYPSEVGNLVTVLNNTVKTIASYLGIAVTEVADITMFVARALRRLFFWFLLAEGFLLGLFIRAICSNNGFAGLIMLIMGIGVVLWLFAASWLVSPLGDRGRAFTNMIQGLAYIPLIMFYTTAILTILPRNYMTVNTVVGSCAFALLLATLSMVANSGGKLLRGFMYALLICCMLIGFSFRTPVVGNWVKSVVATISGSINVNTANNKGSNKQKGIRTNFLEQLQPRTIVESQPLFNSIGVLVNPEKVLSKGTYLLVDINSPMQIGAFANAGVKVYDPQTYEFLGVVPIRVLSSSDEKSGVAVFGSQTSSGGINKNILVPLLIIVLGIAGACFKGTRQAALIIASVALVLWFWIGVKPAETGKLSLQEEKGCDQLIVAGERFVDNEFLIPSKVSGGEAFWEDGRPVRVGVGRPVEGGWPFRPCATNKNMIIEYYILR